MAQKEGNRRRKKFPGSGGKKHGSRFGVAYNNSGVKMGLMVSQARLRDFLVVLVGAVEGLHSCWDGFLKNHPRFEAGKKDLSHEDVAKDAVCG